VNFDANERRKMTDFIGGSVDIAPLVGCEMGCGPNNSTVTETNGTLEANYLIFFNNAETFIIISLDLLYVGKYLQEILRKKLKNFVKKENLFIVASHTHYAPMVDTEKPRFGKSNIEYIDAIAEKISDQIQTNYGTERRNVIISHTRYSTKYVQSRRLKRTLGLKNKKIVLNKVVLGPTKNYETLIKANLILLKANQEVSAVIWNFPCHPTSLPQRDAFDAHYVGEVRQHLRNIYGKNFPFLFLQGFSGDLRPPSQVIKTSNFVEWIRKTLFGSWFKDFEEAEYAKWVDSILREIDQAIIDLEQKPTDSKPIQVQGNLISVPELNFASSSSPSPNEVDFQILDFELFALMGVSAELVYAYQEFLDELPTEKTLIGVGCIGNVFGYIPTTQMQKEGGYEALDYFPYFNLEKLDRNLEENVKNHLKNLFFLQNSKNNSKE
jgi:hypothetical protein